MTAKESQQLERSVRRALFQKELVESRPAMIAGVAIFLGMPAIWTLLYTQLDTQHEVFPGTATVLLLLTGWLFGAVVAAQTICRDFGRAQGAFLLSRPVSPADVLRAKVRAGLTVVGGVAFMVGLWELLLWGLAKSPIDRSLPWTMWLMAAAVTILAFWVALVAATITRQMLSGVMISALVLVLLVTVPLMTTLPAQATISIDRLQALLSSRTTFYLHPMSAALACIAVAIALFAVLHVCLPVRRRPSVFSLAVVLALLLLAGFTTEVGQLWPLIPVLVVAAVAILFRPVALRACRAERGLHLGTQAVAWAIGLTMILLGTLAFTQVGANTRVTATYWDPVALAGNAHKIAIGREHIAVCAWNSVIALYDIDPDGQIRPRTPHLSSGMGFAKPTCELTNPVPVFDEHDRLFVVASVQPTRDEGSGPVDYCEAESWLEEIDADANRVGTTVQLPLPAQTNDERFVAYDAALSADRLFVLYGARGPTGKYYPAFRVTLVVYDRVDNSAPTLKTTLDVGSDWGDATRFTSSRFQHGADGHLYVVNVWLAPIDLSQPDLDPLAGIAGTAFVEPAPPYGGSVLPLAPRLEATSARSGFAVLELREQIRQIKNRRYPFISAQVIGEAQASPWAWLFRFYWPTVVAGGPARVWEVHDTSAICYDVSDPPHPRRIAHVTTYPIQDAVAGPDFLLLDHGAGFSLVRNPR